jgi:hypothetical protein
MFGRILLSCVGAMVLFSGCQGGATTEIGMSEKKWVRQTRGAGMVGAQGNTKVWLANGAYYYFVDDKLSKVVPDVPRVQMSVSGTPTP